MTETQQLLDAHTRLDETRAHTIKGSLRERLDWLIELLTREKHEWQSRALALEAEARVFQEELQAAAHRVSEANNCAAKYALENLALEAEIRRLREGK